MRAKVGNRLVLQMDTNGGNDSWGLKGSKRGMSKNVIQMKG